MEAMDKKMDRRFETMERQLEKIADAVGVMGRVNEGDDDEDRKRLKERLNEALKANKKVSLGEIQAADSWLEYIFGICKPNGRIGKHGSRLSKLFYFVDMNGVDLYPD